MLSRTTTDSLAKWVDTHLTSEKFHRLIPELHPVRWWHPEHSCAGGTGRLVRVLSEGGHILLLASLIITCRLQTDSAPPQEAELELAQALLHLDTESVLATAKKQRSQRKDVFLSYAHEDAHFVDRICSVLRAAGVSVFRDADCIAPGAGIAATVAFSAEQAQSCILVVSRASNNSHWVQRETLQMMARRSIASFILYPVVIEDVPLPDAIKDVFAIDLRGLKNSHDTVLLEHKLKSLIQEIRFKE